MENSGAAAGFNEFQSATRPREGLFCGDGVGLAVDLAAAPDEGQRLYNHFVAKARAAHPLVQTGRFGADMKVHLVNDGPVTIPLRLN